MENQEDIILNTIFSIKKSNGKYPRFLQISESLPRIKPAKLKKQLIELIDIKKIKKVNNLYYLFKPIQRHCKICGKPSKGHPRKDRLYYHEEVEEETCCFLKTIGELLNKKNNNLCVVIPNLLKFIKDNKKTYDKCFRNWFVPNSNQLKSKYYKMFIDCFKNPNFIEEDDSEWQYLITIPENERMFKIINITLYPRLKIKLNYCSWNYRSNKKQQDYLFC